MPPFGRHKEAQEVCCLKRFPFSVPETSLLCASSLDPTSFALSFSLYAHGLCFLFGRRIFCRSFCAVVSVVVFRFGQCKHRVDIFAIDGAFGSDFSSADRADRFGGRRFVHVSQVRDRQRACRYGICGA